MPTSSHVSCTSINTRLPESLAWRNLIVLPSMDVISDDLMKELAFRTTDYSALKTELRNTMMESDLDPSASYALWNQALHRIDARLGRRVRIEFE